MRMTLQRSKNEAHGKQGETMRTRRIGGLLLVLVLGLAGCARDELVGVYEDELGVTRYDFQGKGRVHVSVLGTTVVAEYRLEDDKVWVSGPQGALVLRRQNGELHGPMGLVLLKQHQ